MKEKVKKNPSLSNKIMMLKKPDKLFIKQKKNTMFYLKLT